MGFWSSIFDTTPRGKHSKARGGAERAAKTRSSRAVGVAPAPPGTRSQNRSRGRQAADARRSGVPSARVTPLDTDRGRGTRKGPRDRFAGVTSDRRMDERIRYGAGSRIAPPLFGQPGKSTPRPAAAAPAPWIAPSLWRPAPRKPAVGTARRAAAPPPHSGQPVGASMRFPGQGGPHYDQPGPNIHGRPGPRSLKGAHQR